VSPILVRPVREQFEHDRVIRLLQARWRRRYQVGANVGGEELVPAGTAARAVYPDLVLTAPDRGHRLAAVVEVETGESVNGLEALAQWARFAALRVPFYLYVPSGSVEAARRLCTEHGIAVSEIWSYYAIGDEIRFTMIHRLAPVSDARSRAPRAASTGARRPGAGGRQPASTSKGRKAASPTSKRRKPAAPASKRRKPAAPASKRRPANAASVRRKGALARPAKRVRAAKPARRASPAARAQKRR